MARATRFWEAGSGRTLVGRLATGTDLVAEIERTCAERGITAGEVTVIGAVRRATFAYYHQDERRYGELASETHHEIAGFVGNVSIRDDRSFLHAHATFGDATGSSVTGHLLRGCEVFAAEVIIHEWTDVALVRTHDEATGLAVW